MLEKTTFSLKRNTKHQETRTRLYFSYTVDSYYVVGTKDIVLISLAATWGKSLERSITIGRSPEHQCRAGDGYVSCGSMTRLAM